MKQTGMYSRKWKQSSRDHRPAPSNHSSVPSDHRLTTLTTLTTYVTGKLTWQRCTKHDIATNVRI